LIAAGKRLLLGFLPPGRGGQNIANDSLSLEGRGCRVRVILFSLFIFTPTYASPLKGEESVRSVGSSPSRGGKVRGVIALRWQRHRQQCDVRRSGESMVCSCGVRSLDGALPRGMTGEKRDVAFRVPPPREGRVRSKPLKGDIMLLFRSVDVAVERVEDIFSFAYKSNSQAHLRKIA